MLQQMNESGLCRMLLTDPGEVTHCLDRSMLIARVKGRWRNYQNQKKIKSQSSTERNVKHKCVFCDRREADQINIPCGHVLNCPRCQPHGSQCGLCSAPNSRSCEAHSVNVDLRNIA
ncbi:hypothetical protein FGIG_11153 [Fasciola gigantica]|uniref:RING-type domain-containing protein n=1 Tax=Fasciola gigantica TaxID=46835 RepID=A0A504YD76_FASGI|nr:hypothetical protein FGIG_11153 [Fasciola gigantica]